MGKANFNDGMRLELEGTAGNASKATVEFGLWSSGRSKGEGMEAAKAGEMYWSMTLKTTSRTSVILILRNNL